MAKECVITGKGTLVGGRYSNRIRATQFNPVGTVRRRANLKRRRIYVPELKKSVTVTISTRGLKKIAKVGPYKALRDAGVI